jgi:hypothetical protein
MLEKEKPTVAKAMVGEVGTTLPSAGRISYKCSLYLLSINKKDP